MNKDWEFYKNQYLNSEISQTVSWLESIEKRIESPIERIAFLHLACMSRDLFQPYELVISPQIVIRPYRVDFLIRHWDTDTIIVVECDGHEFHEKTKKQAADDKKRDRFLTKLGYVLLRYTGSQICNNPDEICEDVYEIIKNAQEKKKGDENGPSS